MRSPRLLFLLLAGAAFAAAQGEELPEKNLSAFLENYCLDCHDAETRKGNLDLTALGHDPGDAKAFAAWVKIHDRVNAGEMPPRKKAQPEAAAVQAFLKTVSTPLVAADRAREAAEGRSTWRRLNRYEYENTLRDLLGAPWLQIRDKLPEDGESHRFNRLGEALDVSHVQMARYLGAADYALRETLGSTAERPETKTVRYYAREQKAFLGKMKLGEFNQSTDRATFPMLGTEAQPDVLSGKAPASVGAADPETREREAMGVVASTYEPLEIRFDQFKAPVAGRYRLRFCGHSFRAGASAGKKWWLANREQIMPGERSEPVTVYSETPPRQIRRLGDFDFSTESSVQELDVWLLAGETIRPDASRLFRSRPPSWHNPLATPEGIPGVAFQWMEAEGPLLESWPTAGQRLLFGELPLRKAASGEIEAVPADATADSERLLRAFLARAYRRPPTEAETACFLGVIRQALETGTTFTNAMIAGYSAVLCSPGFVCLEEKPGVLDDAALAARLSYFLWNSEPDGELRALAAGGKLHEPTVLAAQTQRLVADPRSARFVDAFLDYWLDLRKAGGTSPDAELYPDYYLDDALTESAVAESQAYFAEMVHKNLPSAGIVAADFAMVNERLANHYGLNATPEEVTESDSEPAPPLVEGCRIRRVALPPESPRGGLMTQASVLKVTANGTTTSPVVRGAWIMERILGTPPPKPPPSVPAVEPDTRGATTIREQLARHRTQESCNVCHAHIDPPGFALENFDVFGGWRDHYRALGPGEKTPGLGKNGQPFAFHEGPAVDGSGELPDGRKFADIRGLKKLLLADERPLARNLASQLLIYATGAPIAFGDRSRVEEILDRTQPSHYSVGALIAEIVQSDLFRSK